MLQRPNSSLAKGLPAVLAPSPAVPRKGHGAGGGHADPTTQTSPAVTPGVVPDASEPHTWGHPSTMPSGCAAQHPLAPLPLTFLTPLSAHFTAGTPIWTPPARGSPTHPTRAVRFPIRLPREQLALPGLTHTNRQDSAVFCCQISFFFFFLGWGGVSLFAFFFIIIEPVRQSSDTATHTACWWARRAK